VLIKGLVLAVVQWSVVWGRTYTLLAFVSLGRHAGGVLFGSERRNDCLLHRSQVLFWSDLLCGVTFVTYVTAPLNLWFGVRLEISILDLISVYYRIVVKFGRCAARGSTGPVNMMRDGWGI